MEPTKLGRKGPKHDYGTIDLERIRAATEARRRPISKGQSKGLMAKLDRLRTAGSFKGVSRGKPLT